ARTEGLIPAPETSHAVRVAIDEALECKKTGEKKVIVFNFSGHGLLDLSAYDNYFAGKLLDIECTPEMISKGLAELPKVG
ncbi:MAG TPA: TrpB-like pyridoxal-phosphate dependent enzyme, partial [Planctomycetota bacterium]|nr:TrpB-like pyridoxal-phosphate dependent enzyme [Planctomycetota bacterium]